MKQARNRNNSRVVVIASALVIVLGLIVFGPLKFESAIGARTSPSAVSANLTTPAFQSMANFPLAFEANAGQADRSVKFIARAGKSELLLTSHSVTVQSRKSFGVRFVGA